MVELTVAAVPPPALTENVRGWAQRRGHLDGESSSLAGDAIPRRREAREVIEYVRDDEIWQS